MRAQGVSEARPARGNGRSHSPGQAGGRALVEGTCSRTACASRNVTNCTATRPLARGLCSSVEHIAPHLFADESNTRPAPDPFGREGNLATNPRAGRMPARIQVASQWRPYSALRIFAALVCPVPADRQNGEQEMETGTAMCAEIREFYGTRAYPGRRLGS